MTKEEILAMEGVTLDIQVAHLLGYTILEGCYLPSMAPHARHKIMDKEKQQSLLPHYSTDISAAWQIVRRLRYEYWCLEIKIADECLVLVKWLGTPPIKIEVSAGSTIERLPEAICKAALLAKLGGRGGGN